MRALRSKSAALTKAARSARAERKSEELAKKRAARGHAKKQARELARAASKVRQQAKRIAEAKKRVLDACASHRAYLLKVKKELRALSAAYQRRVAKIDKADVELCNLLSELAPGTYLDGDAFGASVEAVDTELSSLKDYLEQIP